VAEPSKTTAAVWLERVAISYQLADGTRYPAVAPVDLGVAAGEFVALVGPTGCGKSTLLNVVAGLVSPSTGRVWIEGVALTGINQRAGYLFQQEALFPWKTALDNVSVGLELRGIPKTEARRRAQFWLERVGLGGFADRYPHQLSGGQKSGSVWPKSCAAIRPSCSWTSRSGHSTPRNERSWATSCSSSGAPPERPSFSSRMTSRKQSLWLTGS